MPKIDDEEKHREQERGRGFLTAKQRSKLLREIFGVILLAILIFAIGVAIFVR